MTPTIAKTANRSTIFFIINSFLHRLQFYPSLPHESRQPDPDPEQLTEHGEAVLGNRVDQIACLPKIEIRSTSHLVIFNLCIGHLVYAICMRKYVRKESFEIPL